MGQGVGRRGSCETRETSETSLLWGRGFCLNVSLVSLVSGGPLKVRGAEPSLSHLSRASFLEGPGGGHPPARRACLTCLNVSGGSSGVRGAGRLPARRGCLRCLACLAGGVLWGSGGGVRQFAELVSLVSMSQGGPLGFGGRGDCQPAEGVSDVSLVSRGGPLGFGGRRPTARRAFLTCLAGHPPGSAELVSVVSLVSGASVLWAGLARGFTQKCRQFFSRFFNVLLA